MFLFENSFSSDSKNELVKGEYLEGYSLDAIITPKKQFTKKKFIVKSESCVVENISFEFWENYILYGKDYLDNQYKTS